jgi:hypothetical protein
LSFALPFAGHIGVGHRTGAARYRARIMSMNWDLIGHSEPCLIVVCRRAPVSPISLMLASAHHPRG